MKQYTVRSGQNIYDVALTLYGTVEGIFDLLISNDWLNMETVLEYGMVVNYHEEFIINQQIVTWLDSNNVLVKNGEHIYAYQDVDQFIRDHIEAEHPDLLKTLDDMSPDEQNIFWDERTTPNMTILQQGQLSTITLNIKPNTHLFIDWGDYTDLQIIEGSGEQELEHCYKSSYIHQIRMYGNAEYTLLDLTKINGIYYPLKNIYADEFKSDQKIEELNKLIITR